MTIEFLSNGTSINQWIINFTKEKMVELHHLNKMMARAEICFSADKIKENGEKICEITITEEGGNSFFIRRHAHTYETAARKIIKELTEKIETQIKNQNGFPDEIITTVDI